ncbi:MAG: hypothetical protein U9O41_07735 [Candidatus Aerophobetes bacterium]|nr:hypothetical protein [Candidatus Aerophobetes bacterium]
MPTPTIEKRRKFSKMRRGYLLWFLILLGLDYIVPYTLLKNVPRIYGSFLFYIIWSLITIVSIFAIFIRWRD